MAPGTVRTVPPWVIKRPPQSILPQHNSTPTEPARHRGGGDHHRHEATVSDYSDEDGTDRGLGTAAGAGAGAAGPSRNGGPQAREGGGGGGMAGMLPQLFKRKPGGRKWDHLRSAEPVIVPQRYAAADGAESQWRDFVASSRYPHMLGEEPVEPMDDGGLGGGVAVDEEVLGKLQQEQREQEQEQQQQQHLNSFGYPAPGSSGSSRAGGLLPGSGSGGGTSQYHALALDAAKLKPPAKPPPPLWKRIALLPLRHPLGPLACRMIVLSTSIIALSLAAKIFEEEKLWGSPPPERTQIVVAIVVDIVAIPYIGYITVDDYTGKPLGLRPPKARIRLILLDLFFIIFKSASTALGFEAMLYFHGPRTLTFLRALGAFELIGLCAWSMTLTINVFREIERLGG